MAITKELIIDKIEAVGPYKNVQVKTLIVIKEDDKEISRSHSRKVLEAGDIDASNNWTDTDISGEASEVQAVCNAVWTTDVKNALKAKLIEIHETS